jgi:hypothetical protein
MPKVFVLNKAGHDYSDAERFGEIVFCTEGSLDKMDTQQMYRDLSTELSKSESCDFLLLTSLASLCSVASAIFAAKHGCLNLLLFHNDRYVVRSIFLGNNDDKYYNR